MDCGSSTPPSPGTWSAACSFSLIEIVASAVVWQLKGVDKPREQKALRLIGVAFMLLALYIGAQSSHVLAVAFRPHHSQVGIAWLALTALAMFTLAYAKSNTGCALDNRVLETEARVTMIDGLLALAVLIGLVLNAAFGWWWADPLAAFVIVYYGLREGRAAEPDDLVAGFVRRVLSFDAQALSTAKQILNQTFMPNEDQLASTQATFGAALGWPQAAELGGEVPRAGSWDARGLRTRSGSAGS